MRPRLFVVEQAAENAANKGTRGTGHAGGNGIAGGGMVAGVTVVAALALFIAHVRCAVQAGGLSEESGEFFAVHGDFLAIAAAGSPSNHGCIGCLWLPIGKVVKQITRAQALPPLAALLQARPGWSGGR